MAPTPADRVFLDTNVLLAATDEGTLTMLLPMRCCGLPKNARR